MASVESTSFQEIKGEAAKNKKQSRWDENMQCAQVVYGSFICMCNHVCTLKYDGLQFSPLCMYK